MTLLAIVILYLAFGFAVCLKCGWYEGLFGVDSLEDIFDHGIAKKPLFQDMQRFILVTVFWPFVCVIFLVLVLLLRLLDTEFVQELEGKEGEER